MSAEINLQGSTFTIGAVALKPIKASLPGWTKEDIDLTNLSNANVKTSWLSKLKTYEDLKYTIEYDTAVMATIPETNSECTVTFPSGKGIKYWGQVKGIGEMSTDTKPAQVEITIKITNLNATGAETPPAAIGA